MDDVMSPRTVVFDEETHALISDCITTAFQRIHLDSEQQTLYFVFDDDTKLEATLVVPLHGTDFTKLYAYTNVSDLLAGELLWGETEEITAGYTVVLRLLKSTYTEIVKEDMPWYHDVNTGTLWLYSNQLIVLVRKLDAEEAINEDTSTPGEFG